MDLATISGALGVVVLERVAPGHFMRVSAAPAWWTARVGASNGHAIDIADAFPIFDVFLPEAERTWQAPGGPVLASDFWTESTPDGELHLSAFATRVGDACVIVIVRNEHVYRQHQLLLQRARELRLTYDALMREIERKDILLHTIVHDLTAPLHSIVGSLSLLRECELPAAAARWTELAVQAASRQRELIAGILSVFVSEQGALATPETVRVDIQAAIERALAEREPLARQRQVVFIDDLADARPVRAEETRLLRVLTNLLDNALRHSPVEGRVRITCVCDDASVRVSVEDDGPGVAPQILPRLFQKLVHDPRGGGTGLGLYFCRITVEQWGGGIGYEPRPGGGAKFWFRLPRAFETQTTTRSEPDHDQAATAR
jgi:signal transduction histidine kinase